MSTERPLGRTSSSPPPAGDKETRGGPSFPCEIGLLRIELPAGFERRAGRIARLVGEALAAQPDLAGRRPDAAGPIAHLAVPPMHVDPRRSDRAIAGHIAQSIRAALGAGGH
jgi:hypothetical protein